MEPAEAWARCTPAQAAVLAPYDHHRALLGSRWGILLTNHWLVEVESPLEFPQDALPGTPPDAPPEQPAAFLLHVVFTLAPQFPLTDSERRGAVLRHPAVPLEIQSLLNELDFQPDPGG